MPAPALAAWLAATAWSEPLWRWNVRRRARRGKEDPARLNERFARGLAPRPEGTILWCHALGIGEALPLVTLLRKLGEARPDLQFLLTTNTRAGADGLARAGLPPRTLHQYLPVDAPGPVRRFLAHWRPEALVLAELDTQPWLLHRASRAGLPMVMVNARLTDRRFRNRRRIRPLFAALAGLFGRILVQDPLTRERMAALGVAAARVAVAGPLKAAADPLPDRPEDRAAFAAALAGRPVWLAAATEAREEAAVLAAHRLAREARPDLLLILAPRQLSHAGETAERIAAAFAPPPRRSAGQMPGPGDAVYLADTMGEMGLWYRLAPLAFVGHSLPAPGAPLTGKNPFEAVALDVLVLHGPHISNFADSYAPLEKAGATVQVRDAESLARAVLEGLAPEARAPRIAAARTVLEARAAALPITLEAIRAILPPPRR
jgi:3-deoxy-D-manno-octulosonic-acid transferase